MLQRDFISSKGKNVSDLAAYFVWDCNMVLLHISTRVRKVITQCSQSYWTCMTSNLIQQENPLFLLPAISANAKVEMYFFSWSLPSVQFPEIHFITSVLP